jgi:hypothetical protein
LSGYERRSLNTANIYTIAIKEPLSRVAVDSKLRWVAMKAKINKYIDWQPIIPKPPLLLVGEFLRTHQERGHHAADRPLRH